MDNHLKVRAGNYRSNVEKHMRNVFDVRKFSQPMQISGADDGSQQVAQEPRSYSKFDWYSGRGLSLAFLTNTVLRLNCAITHCWSQILNQIQAQIQIPAII